MTEHADVEMRFTIESNRLTNITCGGATLAFVSPPSVSEGAFSHAGERRCRDHRQDRLGGECGGHDQYRRMSGHQVDRCKTVTCQASSSGVIAAHLSLQPGFGQPPVAHHCIGRHVQD